MDTSVVVDASVWVSWLITHDVNHSASLLWIEKYLAIGGLLVAPEFLLVEVAASLSRQTGNSALAKETVKYLEAANEIHIIQIDKALIQATISVASDLQMRAGDSIYVAVAYLLKIPLISWDKEQLKKSQGFITTLTPIEYDFPEPEEEADETP